MGRGCSCFEIIILETSPILPPFEPNSFPDFPESWILTVFMEGPIANDQVRENIRQRLFAPESTAIIVQQININYYMFDNNNVAELSREARARDPPATTISPAAYSTP